MELDSGGNQREIERGSHRPFRIGLFPLGRTFATPGALERLRQHSINPADLIDRHWHGDWGDLDADDKRRNDEALKTGERILSSYGEGDQTLWIITESDRSATTILCPEDY